MGKVRYVEAVMPGVDGLVEIMEAPRDDDDGGESGDMRSVIGVGNGEGRSWIADGVDVSLYLEETAMVRLLAMEGL